MTIFCDTNTSTTDLHGLTRIYSEKFGNTKGYTYFCRQKEINNNYYDQRRSITSF